MDNYLKEFGYHTRVIAFINDKSEYKEDIKVLREKATMMANRYNLRIGIVTDPEIITYTLRSMAYLFTEVGKNCMVLRRYDGHVFKISLAELQPLDYV